MKLKITKELKEEEKLTILELWNKEYPLELNYRSLAEFEIYLDKLEDQYHILFLESGSIKGWYFDFIRESERWFAAIIDSSCQGKGYGSQLLNKAKEEREELNGWVVMHDHYKKSDGSSYRSPAEFYKKMNFQFLPEEKLNTEKISAIRIKWKRNTVL